MLGTLAFIGILVVAYGIGVVGWAQIIGSIRQFVPARLIAIILWAAILFVGWYLCHRFASGKIIAVFIGYAISFVQVILKKKIE